MQDYPHHYPATASAAPEGAVTVSSAAIDAIESAPPAEFGGPGDRWSPEALLGAAAADCFILTFRAVARIGRLDWTRLDCDAEGTLDRVERVPWFTGYRVRSRPPVAPGPDLDTAPRPPAEAEKNCMITNSFNAEVTLETEVTVAPERAQ